VPNAARLPANPASLITTTKIATESAKRNANTAEIIGHFAQPGNLPMASCGPAVWISEATLGRDN